MHIDCTILEGHRGMYEQNKAFHEGRSQLKYPDGNHNHFPSLAVDVAPYPIDWQDTKRFCYFAGFVLGTAQQMGIPTRWGGDWRRDHDLSNQSFFDYPHYELHL